MDSYREQTQQIARNFETVEQDIKRRKSPLSQRFLSFLYSIAEPIDGFLQKMRIPPIVSPLVVIIREISRELGDIFERSFKQLAPIPRRRLLPAALPFAPALEPAPLTATEESSIDSSNPYFNDFVDCVNGCYPETAKQVNIKKYQSWFATDPQLASSALLRALSETGLKEKPEKNK